MNRQEYNFLDLDFTIEKLLEILRDYHNDILILPDEKIARFIDFYDYVKNIPYKDYTRNLEVIQRPKYTIQNNAGDCDNKALLIASWFMIFEPDIKQYFKITGRKQFEHIYNVIEMDGLLIPIDSTYNYCKLFGEFDYKKELMVDI